MKELLKYKDFLFLLQSRGLMTLGMQAQTVILGWHLYELKKEPLLLGLMGLTEAIPAILGALIAGPLIDQGRPARFLRGALIVLMLNFFLAWITINYSESHPDSLSVNFQIAILFLVIFISGAGRSFLGPSAFCLLPQLLPRPLIPRASAMNSSVFTLTQILGPIIGGFSFAMSSLTHTFLVPLSFGVLSVSTLLFWKKSTFALGVPPQARRQEPILKSLKAGWTFLYEQKVLLSTMALDMFSVLFGGAVAVLPIFADQVFHVGAQGLGYLRAAPAVGAALSALYLTFFPFRVVSGKKLLFVIAAFGFCIIGFALTPIFWLALILLFASGAFDGFNMVLRGTMTQLLCPEHMRGRVSSLSSVFITSSNEIGAFESGIAASFMGLIPSVLFGGVMTILIVIGVSALVPALGQVRISTDGKS